MTFSTLASPGVNLQGGGGSGSGTANLPISGNGATVTASTPLINGTQTWNDGATTFTALKLNITDTASAAASLLMDLQVGGSSAFNVSKGGSLKLGHNASGTNVAASNVVIAGSQGTGTGAGGSIIFQVALAGSSGPAQNALATAWSISGAGHFLAGTDNTYDIGASGANRPRNLYLGSSILLPASGVITYDGRAEIRSYANGNLTFWNSAATDFGRLQFGGTSSSFPALKRSSTTLQARLADDSAFASVQGKLTTDTAYAAGDPTTTGYLVVYDSTGTAYKIPAVAV